MLRHCEKEEEEEGGGKLFSTHPFPPSFRWPLAITHRGFKLCKSAITQQFNLLCFFAQTLGVCDATVEVSVSANSQSSHSTNSSQMITFGPPSNKVISPSLLSGAQGTAEGCDNLINRSCVDMGHLL